LVVQKIRPKLSCYKKFRIFGKEQNLRKKIWESIRNEDHSCRFDELRICGTYLTPAWSTDYQADVLTTITTHRLLST